MSSKGCLAAFALVLVSAALLAAGEPYQSGSLSGRVAGCRGDRAGGRHRRHGRRGRTLHAHGACARTLRTRASRLSSSSAAARLLAPESGLLVDGAVAGCRQPARSARGCRGDLRRGAEHLRRGEEFRPACRRTRLAVDGAGHGPLSYPALAAHVSDRHAPAFHRTPPHRYDARFDAARWWSNEHGLVFAVNEALKLGFYWRAYGIRPFG